MDRKFLGTVALLLSASVMAQPASGNGRATSDKEYSLGPYLKASIALQTAEIRVQEAERELQEAERELQAAKKKLNQATGARDKAAEEVRRTSQEVERQHPGDERCKVQCVKGNLDKCYIRPDCGGTRGRRILPHNGYRPRVMQSAHSLY